MGPIQADGTTIYSGDPVDDGATADTRPGDSRADGGVQGIDAGADGAIQAGDTGLDGVATARDAAAAKDTAPAKDAQVCAKGYRSAANGGCVDIDECAPATRVCDGMVTCTNTPGSYRCGTCPPGYSGNGLRCMDIDECATAQHECGRGSNCVNRVGTYACSACGHLKFLGFWKPNADELAGFTNLNHKYGIDDDLESIEETLRYIQQSKPPMRWIVLLRFLMLNKSKQEQEKWLKVFREMVWKLGVQNRIKALAVHEEPYWMYCLSSQQIEADVALVEKILPEFKSMITFTADALKGIAAGRDLNCTGGKTIPRDRAYFVDNIDYYGFDDGYHSWGGIEWGTEPALEALGRLTDKPIVITFQAFDRKIEGSDKGGELTRLVDAYWKIARDNSQVIGMTGWTWRPAKVDGYKPNPSQYYYKEDSRYRAKINEIWSSISNCR